MVNNLGVVIHTPEIPELTKIKDGKGDPPELPAEVVEATSARYQTMLEALV